MRLSSGDVEKIASLLRRGEVVSLPTDTLFSLTCDATTTLAVRKIARLKGRDANKPIPVFVRGVADAESFCVFNEEARGLAERFWPGPLTLVLPIRRGNAIISSELLTEGQAGTIAVRAPGHALIQEILSRLQRPITGTSANLSGQPNLLTAAEIEAVFGKEIIVVDAPLPAYHSPTPSTIVECTGPELKILRQGTLLLSI